MIYKNLLNLIGKTPLYQLKQYPNIFVKLEKFNLGGSIKDRIALEIIENAELNKTLQSGMTIIEPTSGNTGIALAMIGRLKGYNVTLVMPENMSAERRSIISAYGANIILTPAKDGMNGAIKKANEIYTNDENKYFLARQFESKSNLDAHYKHTANEILNDLPEFNAFIAGVGTAGSLIGSSKKLKEVLPNLKTIAVEPSESSVLSGNNSGPHSIQGIGAGFIPPLYDATLVDNIIQISSESAFKSAQNLALNEGLFLGISSGANIAAAIEYSNAHPNDKIVVIAPDGGEKYLSMGIFGDVK
ncbi:MAG: cysteine synthase A [Tissierellales bacterium]|jgi:cysteine synthase A|nr:cysteine synthase A [Tissierellales bacterium]